MNILLIENLSLIETTGPYRRWIVNRSHRKPKNHYINKIWNYCWEASLNKPRMIIITVVELEFWGYFRTLLYRPTFLCSVRHATHLLRGLKRTVDTGGLLLRHAYSVEQPSVLFRPPCDYSSTEAYVIWCDFGRFSACITWRASE
jgi:hypothetical protein